MSFVDKVMKSKFGKSAKAFYRRPAVYMTTNILGIFLAIVGTVVCLAAISGAYFMNTAVNKQTVRVETGVTRRIDAVDDDLQALSKIVELIKLPDEVTRAIEKISSKNIERLDSLYDIVEAFNFGGRLEKPLARIDQASDALQTLNDLPEKGAEIKSKPIQKITTVRERLSDIRNTVTETGRSARIITLYAAVLTVILAIIFLVGEITLLRRCMINIRTKDALKQVKHSKKQPAPKSKSKRKKA